MFDIGYDKDRRAITFPVKDRQGRCLFIARRSVVGKEYNYPLGAVMPLNCAVVIAKNNRI